MIVVNGFNCFLIYFPALQNNLLPSKPNIRTPRKTSGGSSGYGSKDIKQSHHTTHQSNGHHSTGRHHSSDTSPVTSTPTR